MSDFYQTAPRLKNTFKNSRWLKAYLQWRMPQSKQKEAFAELSDLGEKMAGPVLALGRQAEREKPVHVPFDPWGKRIDELRISRAWHDLKDLSAETGMVAEGYERRFGEHSRLYQFAKLFLFHPSSAFFTCPLAMADGAARVLEIYGGNDARLKQAFQHLTSRKSTEFWTSGQWMTERAGGSDVSRTSTIAKQNGDHYLLSGVKWFSSATDSEMALGLARIEGAVEGSRGLTLFYIPMRNADGSLNGIEILRLKDKMGTWALPTAELRLQNTKAYPVGELQHGVKTVATMLNITRGYNSVCAAGQMARGLELLSSYGQERQVFGQQLSKQPLFISSLFKEELRSLASFLLTFRTAELLGKDETRTASPLESDLLRLLTPITKLFTGKAAVTVTSEVVEGFGGAGYIEDTGIPSLFRDAQVFSIWEGATNVLSLDLLRVFEKTSALSSFFKEAERILKGADEKNLREHVQNLQKMATSLKPNELIASARHLAFHLAKVYAGLLMLEWAASDKSQAGPLKVALKHWVGSIEKFELVPPTFEGETRQFFGEL
jgi:alkylation response protein AidB-like acyl-CoA dehydrogenase